MGFLSAIFGSKDNSDLKEVIEGGAFLVDVRSSGEFASGSVKGSLSFARAATVADRRRAFWRIMVFRMSLTGALGAMSINV
jgi:rhodanese-related sulfurtransferase